LELQQLLNCWALLYYNPGDVFHTFPPVLCKPPPNKQTKMKQKTKTNSRSMKFWGEEFYFLFFHSCQDLEIFWCEKKKTKL